MKMLLDQIGKKIEPINDAFEPLCDTDVEMLERVIGFKLPVAYVSMLKTYGRCMFGGEATVKSMSGRVTGVFTFFGAKDPAGNILADREAHPDFIAHGYVPIADDMFNNRYVLDGQNGSVLFMDYSDGKSEIVEVAPSFEEFLSRISVGEPEP